MPNLEVLDIDIWTNLDRGPSILMRTLDQAGRLQRERQLGHPLALWGLKKIVVRYYYNSNVQNIVLHLLSLLIIPSVESLCATDQYTPLIDDFSPVETDVDEKNLAAALRGNSLGRTNMKELSLSFTIIRPKVLFQLLRYYPNLKRFCHRDCLEPGYNIIDIDDFKGVNLMAMVSCQNPHLEYLAILSWGYIWSSIVAPSTSSLDPSKSVRHLETTWKSFIGRADNDDGTGSFPSSQRIVDAIPPSLERLSIIDGLLNHIGSDLALSVIYEILQQKHRLIKLQALDFGWTRRLVSDELKFQDAFYYDHRCHSGFTKEDYLRVIRQCQGAGVEVILKPAEQFSPKYVIYFVNDDGDRDESAINEVRHIVHHPYDDYERICNENGCDVETGRPRKD
ncbi:hypothetical protein V494_00220 [Pseudogymnoascus sp. VKM F-4513 (FW-928)]|nr:hypothetical protein V494_00220 [Pseudogymnoascus sp. VKM F-4513 (FW-928)]